MKVARLYAPGDPADVRVETISTPQPGPGEVLVEVKAAAVCATDLRIITGAKKRGVILPAVLGHEIGGTVVEVGRDVAEVVQVGDTVAVYPLLGDQTCPACLRGRENQCVHRRAFGYQFPGGFSEYVLVPEEAVRRHNLFIMKKHVSPEQAALIEPVACCLHGQVQSKVDIGLTVLIAGAGPIGLMHLLLARAKGAAQVFVSEVVESRRAKALELGADAVFDPQNPGWLDEIRQRTAGWGVDAVIQTVGVPGLIDDLLGLVAKGGTLNLFGGFSGEKPAPFQPNLVHYNEISIVGSSSTTREDFSRVAQLVENGVIDVTPLITSRYSLEEAPAAFAQAKNTSQYRVIINPQAQ